MSVENTGRFEGLTHRIGLVLTALRAGTPDGSAETHREWFDEAMRWATAGSIPESTQEPRELRLGADNARAVAREIVANAEAYNEAVRAAILTSDDDVTVRFLPEQPTVRFAPGVVIDFAAFEVLLKKQPCVRGRACVTVCLHESQSKIWTRFSQASHDLTARGFLDRTSRWFDDATKHIADQYQRDIEAVLSRKAGAAEPRLELEARHKIEIVSADLHKGQLTALAEAIETGVPTASVEGARAASENMDTLIRLVHPEAPPAPVSLVHDSAVAGRPAADANTYLLAHRTVRGNFGVYLARAKGWHVVLVGLAGNDDQPLIEMPDAEEDGVSLPQRPASLNVSAELANTVARHF